MSEIIEVDLAQYELERVSPNEVIMRSEYYAEKLRITSRFTEKWAGFYCGKLFVYLDIDNEDGTLTFRCRSVPVTAELICYFFERNIHAIDEIGYECLYPEPR